MNEWTGGSEIWQSELERREMREEFFFVFGFCHRSSRESKKQSSSRSWVEFDSDRRRSESGMRCALGDVVVIVIKMIFIIIFCYFHSFEFLIIVLLLMLRCSGSLLAHHSLNLPVFNFTISKGSAMLASYNFCRRHSSPSSYSSRKSLLTTRFSPFHWFFPLCFFFSCSFLRTQQNLPSKQRQSEEEKKKSCSRRWRRRSQSEKSERRKSLKWNWEFVRLSHGGGKWVLLCWIHLEKCRRERRRRWKKMTTLTLMRFSSPLLVLLLRYYNFETDWTGLLLTFEKRKVKKMENKRAATAVRRAFCKTFWALTWSARHINAIHQSQGTAKSVEDKICIQNITFSVLLSAEELRWLLRVVV